MKENDFTPAPGPQDPEGECVMLVHMFERIANATPRRPRLVCHVEPPMPARLEARPEDWEDPDWEEYVD